MYPLFEVTNIKNFLIKHQETLAVAESVTSGHLQAAFSLADDARSFFQGGITTYNLGQKCRHLLVEPVHAISCDCVSAKVAEQMAIEVTNLFLSDYGVAITGYAAKVPEKNIQTLFAHFAISKNGSIIVSEKLKAPDASALDVQIYYTREVIRWLENKLSRESTRPVS